MSSFAAISTLILLLISSLFFKAEKEKVFVIIDDCQQWEKRRPIDEQYFSITNNKVWLSSSYYSYDEQDTLASVHLFNGNIDLNPPELLEMSLAEMLNSGVQFSSEIGVEDWCTFNSEGSELYIILPEDFCSEKEFLHSTNFTLYKTRVRVDYPGPECVFIDDPMRFFPTDTSRRNRGSDK
ncbi:hypothetical protein ACPUEN_16790 [Algoriphagus yeomjeoni]|uniref:hypothetical protein n=1 Tax=Algoriphagus yeomjeoni TaxID=291403 RepID=UPI003CE4A510